MNKSSPSHPTFHALGIVAALLAGALACRIVWEKTWLTWRSGPQMVGFSLAHGEGVLLLMVGPPLLVIWVLAVLVRFGIMLRRRTRPSRADWVHSATAVLICGALFTPYAWWQTLFADRVAHSPYAGEFLSYAAATGDLRTVKALASHGTPLTAIGAHGQTSLGAAAVGNQPRVIAYLLEHGVPVNTVNASGDSALDEAMASNSLEAVTFLTAHGAARIHGSSAQHDSVTRAVVDRAIKDMDSASVSSHKPAKVR